MLPFDPKKPLFGLKMRFPHAERRIHVFSEEAHSFYFRPKHAPEDWWGGFWTDYRAPNVQSYQRWVSNCREWLQGKNFFRVFVLPDPRTSEERLWCIWWRPDCGYVVPLNHPFNLEGAFFLCESKYSPSLTRASTAQLRTHFQQEWHAPHSDVREALSWCDLTLEEREWRSIRWKCGGREMVESVAVMACIVETEWDKGYKLRLHFGIYPQSKSRPDNGLSVSATVSELRWRDEGRLTRLFKYLQEHNRGFYDTLMGTRNDWRFSFIAKRPRPPYYSDGISINIAPPSQHERMEASLFLRDWLRDNAPDLLPDWFPEAL